MRLSMLVVVLLSSFASAQDDAEKPHFAPSPRRGERIYKTYCHHCHGPEADGTGHMGKSLPTQPTDLTDPALESQLTEDKIFKLVRDGSAKQGGSIFMIAWRVVLKDDEIHDVAQYTVNLAAAGRAKRLKK